ncbi:beta-galactosidase [Streptomyces narbonensis]|uniref:beta-galactosidase n=1 Tax=Streptomyces narbonensis TaxID=67333 RepID=UPI0033C7F0C3
MERAFPRRGEFRLDGGLDPPRFLDTAAAEGLHVLLRPGPYIRAEWEGGVLPSSLLAEDGLVPRSRDGIAPHGGPQPAGRGPGPARKAGRHAARAARAASRVRGRTRAIGCGPPRRRRPP